MGDPAAPAESRLSVLDHALDADSHEMVPVHLWPDVFGDEIEPYVDLFSGMSLLRSAGVNTMVREDIEADRTPITPEIRPEMKTA